MNGLKKHLAMFPRRIRSALESYPDRESLLEIRLRRGLPLSVTDSRGNRMLDSHGAISTLERALRCDEKEIREFVCAFCKGSVYRYFDTLKEGFIVDDDGYRLGVCTEEKSTSFLPESFSSVNLRIPRDISGAAAPFMKHFQSKPPASTLIISKPGIGKTTLIRDLAKSLSNGIGFSPMRVAVIDERRELFPTRFASGLGMVDIIGGMSKEKSIETALRIFSPEVILCDEIGNEKEARALLQCGTGGCLVIATAHGNEKKDVMIRPSLRLLIEEGLFSYLAILRRKESEHYATELLWEAI